MTTREPSNPSLAIPTLGVDHVEVDGSASDLPASKFSPIPIVMSRGDTGSSMGSYNSSHSETREACQLQTDSLETPSGNSSADSNDDDQGRIVLQANHQHRLSTRRLKDDNGNTSSSHSNGPTGDPRASDNSLGGGGSSSSSDGNNEAGKSLLAPLTNAWGWIQKQKEKHREQHLKQLAEEQMQKLKQVQKTDPSVNFSVAVDDSSDGYSDKIGCATPQHYPDGDSSNRDDDEDDISWIPPVRCVEEQVNIDVPPSPRSSRSGEPLSSDPTKPVPFLLNPAQMHDIARHVLPKGIAFCRWRRLYSLTRDGDSFFQCLRLCGSEPKTLMVIKTTRGAIFGGYADSLWEIQSHQNGNFHGSAQACLFSFAILPTANDATATTTINGQQPLKTDTNLRVFHWTGANRYIQFTDKSEHRRMLAFGGGGQEGSFGLCVEQDFQLGSTGHCDTFDNLPLCDQENFNILDMEIWGFLTGQF
ncbi:receptor coactivator 7 [Seminavis robusta]|uniref:Oxidation resistance protein 1 n=1 Tax=Seminavis robusta TaxID=568900 RepID=A0A9N8ELE8_9STRA|nr:receptor coactivator 7 [Seminavis robusta]|eukprot:Sro1174_g249070.1 receptor coactivator 7 (474) ;mRNA; f:25689-27110